MGSDGAPGWPQWCGAAPNPNRSMCERIPVSNSGPVDDVLTAEAIGEVFGVDAEVRFSAYSGRSQVSYKYESR